MPWLLVAILLTSFPLRAVPLHLDFFPEVDGQKLFIDSLRYAKDGNESFSLTRLDWLASDFAITTASGQTLTVPGSTALISSRGGSYTLPDLRDAHLTSISFFLGPDTETNHSDPAHYGSNHPLNPNRNKLHWDWQGGYIFLALEGHWRRSGQDVPSGFAYHFANDWNRTKITLPIELKIRNESRVAIGFDVHRLLAGIHFAEDGHTTHSHKGDPVAFQLKQNLPTSFRIAGIHRGGLPRPPDPPPPFDLPASPKAYPITLPTHIPLPSLPSDNPLLRSRVDLGERLFHDTLLSKNHNLSCASCHQGTVMSDPRPLSPGTDGRVGRRHSMPLFNLAWKNSFFWDGRATSLRQQALIPIEDPLEMNESLEHVVRKLKASAGYPEAFAHAFGSGAITPNTISMALETFLLTRLSLNSRFDQAMQGKTTLTAEEQRGFELFFTESEPRLNRHGADCFHCHGGALFTDHSFHHNGLTSTDDHGLEETTGRASDRYKFSTPSLRNIALTAPYMHDGRFATLEEVVDHYNEPMEASATLDPNLAKRPNGLGLSAADKIALIAFLKTLTDPAFLATSKISSENPNSSPPR
ncbi:MAG: MbnP family protein [Verrucomicrobiales bacterium]